MERLARPPAHWRLWPVTNWWRAFSLRPARVSWLGQAHLSALLVLLGHPSHAPTSRACSTHELGGDAPHAFRVPMLAFRCPGLSPMRAWVKMGSEGAVTASTIRDSIWLAFSGSAWPMLSYEIEMFHDVGHVVRKHRQVGGGVSQDGFLAEAVAHHGGDVVVDAPVVRHPVARRVASRVAAAGAMTAVGDLVDELAANCMDGGLRDDVQRGHHRDAQWCQFIRQTV